jgi:hypothetical protein
MVLELWSTAAGSTTPRSPGTRWRIPFERIGSRAIAASRSLVRCSGAASRLEGSLDTAARIALSRPFASIARSSHGERLGKTIAAGRKAYSELVDGGRRQEVRAARWTIFRPLSSAASGASASYAPRRSAPATRQPAARVHWQSVVAPMEGPSATIGFPLKFLVEASDQLIMGSDTGCFGPGLRAPPRDRSQAGEKLRLLSCEFLRRENALLVQFG